MRSPPHLKERNKSKKNKLRRGLEKSHTLKTSFAHLASYFF